MTMSQLAIGGRKGQAVEVLGGLTAYYRTPLGIAYLTDSLAALRELPPNSINLIVTSPPYALHFKKAYGNVHKDEYVKWFLGFAKEFHRVLRNDGSFVLNIGGSY